MRRVKEKPGSIFVEQQQITDMLTYKTTVHGSMFYLLKKFVVHHFSESVWNELLMESGKDQNHEFVITEAYELNDMNGIIQAASRRTGKSSHELQEMFGEWLVPDLFHFYANYLRPEWKTYDILINTEQVFHGAVRNLNSTAHPPILNVSEIATDYLMIDYYSKRKMGSLAVGIIKGIARYYNEQDEIDIIPTTEPEAERVQIKVIFKKR